VAWEKGNENPRFADDAGQRVNEEGDVVRDEGRLDLDDVDPGEWHVVCAQYEPWCNLCFW
jgi:hypothetical protein